MRIYSGRSGRGGGSTPLLSTIFSSSQAIDIYFAYFACTSTPKPRPRRNRVFFPLVSSRLQFLARHTPQSMVTHAGTEMDANKDNANPTVLDPSDLPSRLRSLPTATARRGIFDALPTAAYPHPTTHLTAGSSEDLFNTGDSASSSDDDEENAREEIDEQEVYDLISPITDPEHPLSLGSLGVVNLADISIVPPSSPRSRISSVRVLLTPTTSACSLTTVIGLGVKVRLVNALPPRFRIDVRIKEGTSSSAAEANKQLGDKERVAAAMENRNLISMVTHMLSSCD